MLTDVEVRECFHVNLLELLASRVRTGALILKGGVNLRLYFGSIRYSEDIDFDAAADAHLILPKLIPAAIRDVVMWRRLRLLGIRDLEFTDRAKKKTDTTLRYSLGLVIGGGVVLPTKIDISYREHVATDPVERAPADRSTSTRYLGDTAPPLYLLHYRRTAAVRQKLVVLAKRTPVQARDVFDLCVLVGGKHAELHNAQVDLPYIRSTVSDSVLQSAQQRTTEITYGEYLDQVVLYLDPQNQAVHGTEQEWDRQQVLVLNFIDLIMTLPVEAAS